MKRCYLPIVILLIVGLVSGICGQDKELTIDECVQIALKQNPDIVRGEFTVQIAGKDVTVAMSNFLPRLSGVMQYYHSVVGPSSVLRIDPGTGIPVFVRDYEITSWSSSARLSVNQTVFNGGTNIFNYNQSRALKESAVYNFENTKQTTILLVKERYYNLLAAEKLLGVAEETLKSSEESYKRAEVFFQVGKAPKADVLQARVQQETDRLSLIQAQNSLAIASASMNHVLGFDVDQEIKVVDDLNVPEVEVGYDDAVSNAFNFHPALKSQDYDVKAAKAGIGMAVGRYLPSLYAYYSYSWSHRDFDQIKNLLDTDYNWYVGAQLSIPIFQGLSRFANLSQAKLMHKSSQEALDQARRDIALETKQAYFEVQQAKKQIAVALNAVEAAEEGLRLNQERYKLGAGTLLELIVAQVSYAAAQSNHIQGLYNYKYAIARLQRAMGKLVK